MKNWGTTTDEFINTVEPWESNIEAKLYHIIIAFEINIKEFWKMTI